MLNLILIANALYSAITLNGTWIDKSFANDAIRLHSPFKAFKAQNQEIVEFGFYGNDSIYGCDNYHEASLLTKYRMLSNGNLSFELDTNVAAYSGKLKLLKDVLYYSSEINGHVKLKELIRISDTISQYDSRIASRYLASKILKGKYSDKNGSIIAIDDSSIVIDGKIQKLELRLDYVQEDVTMDELFIGTGTNVKSYLYHTDGNSIKMYQKIPKSTKLKLIHIIKRIN